jgi:hypothetical protein
MWQAGLGLASRGRAGQGGARQGMAGVARWVRAWHGASRQAWHIKGPYVPRRRCLAAAAFGALGIGYLTGRKIGRVIAERFDRRT